ncbi:diguanylate cyclase domain-containing protein [Kosakonia sp. MH5]|uniref:diguanylate cyclase domain-containing protein n=1 Tax=Kosakonia sp. MH5 TaxID=2202822 RepID=UPI00192A59CF|nr:diguanylate cyclase [Kosakonia sp. MH5]
MKKRNFSAEFKRESAQLVLDQNYTFEIQGQTFFIGASIGIAIYPDHGTDGASLKHAADQAMYAVKRDGGGGFRFAL